MTSPARCLDCGSIMPADGFPPLAVGPHVCRPSDACLYCEGAGIVFTTTQRLKFCRDCEGRGRSSPKASVSFDPLNPIGTANTIEIEGRRFVAEDRIAADGLVGECAKLCDEWADDFRSTESWDHAEAAALCANRLRYGYGPKRRERAENGTVPNAGIEAGGTEAVVVPPVEMVDGPGSRMRDRSERGEPVAGASVTPNACVSCETRPSASWCRGCIIEDYQAHCGCTRCVVRDTPSSGVDELARAKAFRDHNDGTGTVKMSTNDVLRLGRLLRDVRRETIEECAKECEAFLDLHKNAEGLKLWPVRECVSRIRALPKGGADG